MRPVSKASVKRWWIVALLTCAFQLSLVAQDSTRTAFHRGQSSLMIGYGIGNIWKTFLKDAINGSVPGITYKVTSFGPIALDYEYAINKRFSVGAVVSYSKVQGKYSGFGDSFVDELKIFTALARANYHMGKHPKFDRYVGVGLGYVNAQYANDQSASRNDVPGVFGYSAQLGGRYFFTRNLSAFLELGYVNGSFVLTGASFAW
jgi:outer membrane protein W